MALSETELMTAANMMLRRYGDIAAAMICGRIAQLELDGDSEGADTWALILERLGELESGMVGTLQ